jgi:hypothetical protein
MNGGWVLIPALQGSVAHRTLDQHPGASISSLILSVSCPRCAPNAPFAKLKHLSADLT